MSEVEKIEFRRTRDFSEVLNATFAFVRQNFKRLGKSILFIVGPLILIMSLVYGLMQVEAAQFQGESLNSLLIYYGVYFVLLFIAFPLLFAVVYGYVRLYMDEEREEIEVEDVWKSAKRHYLRILLALLSITVIVLFVFFIGAFLAALFGEGFPAFMTILVFLLLAVFLYIRWMLAPFVLIREEVGVGSALARSGELVRNNWWFTFGLLIVVGMIQFVLALIFYVPEYALTFFTALHGTSGDLEAGGLLRVVYIVASVLSHVANFSFYSLPLIALAFHYANLVERKEAAGLLGRIEQIGATDES